MKCNGRRRGRKPAQLSDSNGRASARPYTSRSWRTAILGIVLAACAPEASQPTEILWDTWGVPHIYASTDSSLFKAFGYAQAASHGNLMLRLYGQARGRAAEYWGARYLEEDRYVRTMAVPSRAAEWYVAQSPAFKTNLDAFAAGVNQYASEHPEAIAPEYRVALPVTATDVLAHAMRVIHFSFVSGNERVIRMFTQPAEPGSNMWAVGPKRSASGNAMLLVNPHLAWTDFQLFYESHWNRPGLNAYGVSLVGFPTFVIAFNDSLGWSHTVNAYDGADEYRLTKVEGGYRWNGGVQPFETSREIIKVREEDGGVGDDTLVIRRSIHGPVTADSGTTAIARRVAGLDQPGMLEEWWDLTRANNLTEFEGVLRRLAIPMFNVIYADRAGHIFYLFGGRVPRRPRGDVAYWAGRVPGDSTSTLWTSTLAYDELPRLTDPATGWLQNANDPPWTVTVPLPFNPDTFPPYLAHRGFFWRPLRSATMLAQDSNVTFHEMVAYKHSTRMQLADRVLDELIGAARSGGGADAKRAADVLERWDRQARAESRGAVLFMTWIQKLAEARIGPDQLFEAPWRPDSALTTPHGLAEPARGVRALEAAAAQVEKDHGALDVPYGDVMRLRYRGRDLPGNGAPGDPYGVFRTAYYIPAADGKSQIVGGDTYYAVIEFGDPIRAKVLTAYGNASQPGSRHAGDQLELFAREEMRDAWRIRAEVERHLERRDVVR